MDGSRGVTRTTMIGDWRLIEFAGKSEVFYRISGESSNDAGSFLTFDFVPSKQCVPPPAVMNKQMPYDQAFADGMLPMNFKVPTQPEAREIVRTSMEPGDTWLFMEFRLLTVAAISKGGGKGNLAVWIPANHDGTVQRTRNIYFSLDGFSRAVERARMHCQQNR